MAVKKILKSLNNSISRLGGLGEQSEEAYNHNIRMIDTLYKPIVRKQVIGESKGKSIGSISMYASAMARNRSGEGTYIDREIEESFWLIMQGRKDVNDYKRVIADMNSILKKKTSQATKNGAQLLASVSKKSNAKQVGFSPIMPGVSYGAGGMNYNSGLSYGSASGLTGEVYNNTFDFGSAYYQAMKKLTDYNNKLNIAMMREQNQFNHDEAQLQRDFEQQMSSTAHQREVADLQAAGLNPVLSANAGASTPTGSAASSSNFAGADTSMMNALTQLVGYALSANAQMTAAGISAAAQRDVASANLYGTMYGSDNSAAAARYAANKSYDSQALYTDTLKRGQDIDERMRSMQALLSILPTGYVKLN